MEIDNDSDYETISEDEDKLTAKSENHPYLLPISDILEQKIDLIRNIKT
jgi:hypothetical protein